MSDHQESSPDVKTCPACRIPLQGDEPGGLCPKCLLIAGVADDSGRHLHIRCPQCQSAIEVVDDPSVRDVTCPSCNSRFSLIGATDATLAAKDGGKVGRFELIERVGIGAFGSVWKALDPEIARHVAIKLPRKDQVSPADGEQFLREAQAAGRLRHPGIIAVHEVGRDGDRIYIVSDFVQGGTLADSLSAQRPSVREAAEICRLVADALQHAHQHAVIHRDLKPSNIMLDETGRPHVMDFGLAKREAAEITMTVEGRILGTPAYMSPEQARGDAHRADARSDIYSLGVILFEMLTGEKPFRGTSQMLLHQVLHEDPPNPRKLNGSVPRELETICLKCLEKEPEKRFASARELADELKRYLAGEPILSRPISSLERSWRWCRRNRVVAGLLLAVCVSLVGGAAVATAFAVKAHDQAIAARISAEAERKQREIAERLQIESQRNLYIAHMNLVDNAVDAGNLETARSLLAQHVPNEGGEDFRAFEWYHFRKLCDSVKQEAAIATPAQWMAVAPDGNTVATALLVPGMSRVDLWDLAAEKSTSIESPAGAMDFSSDGQWLAIAELTRSKLRVWDVKTKTKIFEVTTAANPVSVEFSPDDKFVATGIEDTITIFDATSGKMVRTLIGAPATITSLAFLSDGNHLIAGCKNGALYRWELTGNDQGQLAYAHQEAVTQIQIIPTTEMYASLCRDGIIQIRSINNDSLQRTIIVEDPRRFTVSPDGRTLLVTQRDARLVRGLDTSTGQEFVRWTTNPIDVAFLSESRAITIGESISTWRIARNDARTMLPPVKDYSITGGNSVQTLAISPDGERVLGSDKSLRLVENETTRWLESHDAENVVTYSPLGHRIATGSSNRSKLTVWDATNGEIQWSRNVLQGNVQSVSFSTDGSLLASGSSDGTILMLDVSTGATLHRLAGLDGVVNCVAFAPDRDVLVSAGRGVQFWNAKTGQRIETVASIEHYVKQVAFSPDGKFLIGCGSKSIYLWDAATLQLIRTLSGHAEIVYWVAVSPDSRTIASASQDRTVRLWDATSGQEKASFGFNSTVSCVEFSADGQSLAVADGRNVTVLYGPHE